MKTQVIATLKADFPLAVLLEAAGLARSTFFHHQARLYRSWLGQVGTIAPNVLDRQFSASAPNTKWVTDVTEFRIGDRKVYLSPVIDLFDRSVVAYAHGPSPSLDLTNSSLREAVATLSASPRQRSSKRCRTRPSTVDSRRR